LHFSNIVIKEKQTCNDLVDSARAHIQSACKKIQDRQDKVFSFAAKGDFEETYFTPDLVELKYDFDAIEMAENRWKEVGQHFGSDKLIDKISNTDGKSAVNVLIEVTYCLILKSLL
jgi:hypothetical protein